jgi:hypothetical protein
MFVFFASVERKQYFASLSYTRVTDWHLFAHRVTFLRLRPFVYAPREARTTKKLPLCDGDLALRLCRYSDVCAVGRTELP